MLFVLVDVLEFFEGREGMRERGRKGGGRGEGGREGGREGKTLRWEAGERER